MSTPLVRIFASLPQLQAHLLDPAVTDIMVNDGGRRVFIERHGFIERTDITIPTEALESAIVRIAHFCHDDISEEQPLLDGRLPDGSRVSAMLPPCAVDGPTLTIRKFGKRYTLEQLVTSGSTDQDVATWLREAIRSRKNILISGGTGTGKTTLLMPSPIPSRTPIASSSSKTRLKSSFTKTTSCGWNRGGASRSWAPTIR